MFRKGVTCVFVFFLVLGLLYDPESGRKFEFSLVSKNMIKPEQITQKYVVGHIVL
jgi:hypothetical protein